jgi:iron complex outermembrane receptor protein
VTGGASAAWGSDAVAGVVNILLDDELVGFRGDTQYGRSEHNDDRETSASLAFGTGFAGDRGHLVIGGDFLDNEGILNQSSRDWAARNWTLFSNPSAATNGQPARIITPDAHLSRATYGGVVISGPPALRGQQFGPGGVLQPFAAGPIVGTLYQLGGDGIHLGDGANLSAPRERKSGFSKLKFDITDGINVFAEASYAKSETTLDIVETSDNGSSTITIRRDNAYLSDAVRALIPANVPSFTMGRVHAELGREINTVSNEVKRAAAGFEGSFGEGWSWDAYYQYGKNRYDARLGAHRIEALWRDAVDAVINPATGQPVCRSTLTDPTNGCLPINVFGPNAIDPAAGARVIGTQVYVVDSTQEVAAFDVQGDPFSLWAGPVSIASGFEYRKETMDGDSDPISKADGWRYGNPKPVKGDFNVKEIYAETVIPLARDLPFARNVELNGAGRYTDYSTIGEVVTWKAGLNFSPIDQVRLRATRSRDIRAPNIGELFSTGNAILVSVTDPATLQDSRILGVTGGNPNLSEEVADTLTAGIVYEPSWGRGLHLAVDYYEIQLEDAIAAIAAQGVIDRCYRGQTNFCSAISRDPATGLIVRVDGGQFNLQQLNTRGIDFELGYSFPLSAISNAPGNLSLRLFATRVFELSTTSDTTTIESAGQVVGNGVPKWNANFSSIYANGPSTFSLRARYVGGGNFNNAYGPSDISDNSVSGRFYLFTSFGYNVIDNDTMSVQLFGKIDNLLDKDPPITPDAGVQPLAANAVHYDRIGRTYALGVRFKF